MGLTEIRKRATAAAENTDNSQIALLANAVIGLCDRIEGLENSHTIDMNQIEVEERFGRMS